MKDQIAIRPSHGYSSSDGLGAASLISSAVSSCDTNTPEQSAEKNRSDAKGTHYVEI